MKKQIIATAAVALAATAAFAPAAQADDMPTQTLADILLADDAESGEANVFDTNQNDFDIVTAALLATDGLNGLATAAGTPGADVTVFLPTDKAFRILVDDLFDVSIKDEAALFDAILGALTAEEISDILRYHVLGFTADSTVVTGLESGTPVPTLLNVGTEMDPEYATFDVTFKGKKQIRLVEEGGPGRDPIVRAVDIHATNGVAHVIDRVLIPG